YYQWKEGINTPFKHQYDSGAVWVSPKYTTTYVLETTDFRFEKSYDTIRVVVELCDLKANEVYICHGDSLLLNPIPKDSLQHFWEPNVFLNSSTVQSPICNPKTDVAYFHYAINDSGIIVQKDTLLVRLFDCSPARSDTSICLGDGIYLGNPAFIFASYEWLPMDWLDNNLIANPLAHPPKNIIYFVSATDTNGIVHKDSVSITVKACNLPPEIEIPNVITPNGDGINDVFNYQNDEFWDIKTEIFNRWGQLVFSGDGSERWDGRFQGNQVSDGVYFYQISAQAIGFEVVLEYRGSVSVLSK
ncbi:MAG: hypothetical protein DRI84_03280, partial [Bacteroidetes bacterium]